MALLVFESSTIPELTEEYLSFDFYMLDISCHSKEKCQEKLLNIKRELDSVKDKVIFLKLRCYRVEEECFIHTFKNLVKLSLYNVSLKVVSSVLNTLNESSINLKHLSISLQEEQTDNEQKKVTKFKHPSLTSLRLAKFDTSTIMEMFDFSNVRTLKLIDCSLRDLPISDAIEELEIEQCDKSIDIHKILMLKNLKSLRFSVHRLFPISEFVKVFLKVESLRRISLSSFISTETIVGCLLKDNIQEIDLSDTKIICEDDPRSIRAISCALCATTAKKLHLNECTLNSLMLNVLRENSRCIEYISLRKIFIIDNNNSNESRKAFEELIKHAWFRVCDLRYIEEEYITSPILHSNIGKIIIDSRCSIVQKFSKLIESGKAISINKDIKVIRTLSFQDRLCDRNPILDINNLDKLYVKYFPIYYIDAPDNMKANLREILTIRDTKRNIVLNTTLPSGKRKRIYLFVEDNLCIHTKLPSNRQIIIPHNSDHIMEINSGYDFTIIIHTKDGEHVKETRIPCHKSILSSRSEMFRTMFNVQMKENLLNEMTTDNIYYKDFIEYLYTHKVCLNEENIFPLIDLARMHFVKDLEYKIIGYVHRKKMNIESWILEKYDLTI
jgi:hypothetical protein